MVVYIVNIHGRKVTLPATDSTNVMDVPEYGKVECEVIDYSSMVCYVDP